MVCMTQRVCCRRRVQSMSSVVLDQYQQLLKDHLVVTLFLTMLVGAGGNAGAPRCAAGACSPGEGRAGRVQVF